MRIRGHGLPQSVPKVVEKPAERAGAAEVAGGTAEPGVLKPGQQIVLPARTGLQHFKDHFDARPQVDYQARLGGEATAAKADAEKPAPGKPAEPEAEMTPEAFDDAMSLMDQLPPILLSPAALARAAAATARKVEPEPEPESEPETDPGAELLLDDEQEDEPAYDEDEPEVAVEPRAFDAPGGVFTLDDGSLDASGRRLCTLEAYLDGDVPHVSVAVNLAEIPYGARLRIPALDAVCGQPVPLRAVHERDATRAGAVEVCVSEPDGPLARVLMGLLQVRVG